MISLVLPYWQRKTITDRSLELLEAHYRGLDLEVIVVDDGSPEPYSAPASTLDVRVIRLPGKDGPLSPSVPLNRGVAAARGDTIALSNPETLHVKPVLERLREAAADGMTYASAAVWCCEQQRWHAHSTVDRSDDGDVGSFLPKGAQYHFMAVLSRRLFERAGGFDEDYRDGAGYDDADFIMRIARAGARFVTLDDEIVLHHRAGARARWPQAGFRRNRALFLRKWGRCLRSPASSTATTSGAALNT